MQSGPVIRGHHGTSATRAAVILRYGYDFPYSDIAAALDSSEEAARAAASSGVRRLRRKLR